MNSKLFYTFKDGIGQYDCYPDTRAEFIMRWRQNYVIGATMYQKHRFWGIKGINDTKTKLF